MADLARTIAIVLAAGVGKRMGSPKALMLVDGEPWWALQSVRLQSVGVESIWVVSDAVETEMAGHARAPARRVSADPQAPMMASVLAGVRALSEDPPEGVFVLPIDTPAPRRNVWIECCAADAIAAPIFEERSGHPVYLPWGWVADRLLDINLDPESARLDEMIAGSIKRIPTDDPDAATNLNRPEDLDDWLQRNRSES